jgi:hypothetical protein
VVMHVGHLSLAGGSVSPPLPRQSSPARRS